MDGILESIEDWIRGLLVSGIMNNLRGAFDSVNAEVASIATEVGETPANFSPAIYSMIRNISDNVIMPIAGMILTFIACYELIQLIMRYWALQYGPYVEVLEPESLRDQLKADVAGMYEKYWKE